VDLRGQREKKGGVREEGGGYEKKGGGHPRSRAPFIVPSILLVPPLPSPPASSHPRQLVPSSFLAIVVSQLHRQLVIAIAIAAATAASKHQLSKQYRSNPAASRFSIRSWIRCPS
jgi:hypothetical protein